MADLLPAGSFDSCQRIQYLWEVIQRDIVELEAESDQPAEQIWSDFLNGDQVYGTQFFKDFVEIFYITMSVVNEKNDEDIARLIKQIESWKNAVKNENRMSAGDRRKVDLNLVGRGISLFREYETVMMSNNLVTVVNKHKGIERGH